MYDLFLTIQTFFQNYPVVRNIAEYAVGIAISSIFYLATIFYIIPLIIKYALKTKVNWDDFLIKERIPQTVALIISLTILLELFSYFTFKPNLLYILLVCIIISVCLLLLFRCVNFLIRFYDTLPFAKRKPIKNFGQLLKIILTVFALILIISVISGKSPLIILSGIGAVSAVMAFIFKDTIMAFIAGIQIAGLNIMSVGDWLEAPEYNANGEVIEITLYTVKIKNWDMSISLVPINKLMETNFKNWKGMIDANVRRIQRSLLIDMNTIRALTPEEVDALSKFSLLTEYITNKVTEINAYNKNIEERHIDPKCPNIRYLTNVGTFREYMKLYLMNHPAISQSSTLMIKQLQPTELGLPLDVYAFVNQTDWVFFENTQSEIFDHFLSVVHLFGLKLYQQPTGSDFRSLKS